MRFIHKIALYVLACAACNGAVGPVQDCPGRPYPNTIVKNPPDVDSSNGVLKIALTLRSREMMELPLKVCYAYEAGPLTVESPTLRLNPGDLLDLSLADRMSYVRPHQPVPKSSPYPHNPCGGGTTATTSTNIEFYGLVIPPGCHAGEVSATTIENTDPPFDYQFQIPKDHPPGLYWYHPDRQGSATLQLNGGASGALIIGGMEKAKPEVAGLPERVLIVRQQFDEPDSWPPGEYRLSLNFQPAFFPQLPSPIIQMKPGAKEFWRVANATSQAFLALQVVFGNAAQTVTLVALDGASLPKNFARKTIELPPGGRAEFIVNGPAAGQTARLMQTEFESGRTAFENPQQELAKIVAVPNAEEPPAIRGGVSPFVPRPEARATLLRKLYFAEAPNGTNGPTNFFLTVQGQTPRKFDPSAPPAVATKVGSIENWTVANHSGETHAFHLHGAHFLLLEENGHKLPNPELRDTVTLPAWEGHGPFPTVTLQMDFRDPRAAGRFVLECSDPHHAQSGMMANLQVNP